MSALLNKDRLCPWCLTAACLSVEDRKFGDRLLELAQGYVCLGRQSVIISFCSFAVDQPGCLSHLAQTELVRELTAVSGEAPSLMRYSMSCRRWRFFLWRVLLRRPIPRALLALISLTLSAIVCCPPLVHSCQASWTVLMLPEVS